jgi:hypothetical protein
VRPPLHTQPSSRLGTHSRPADPLGAGHLDQQSPLSSAPVPPREAQATQHPCHDQQEPRVWVCACVGHVEHNVPALRTDRPLAQLHQKAHQSHPEAATYSLLWAQPRVAEEQVQGHTHRHRHTDTHTHGTRQPHKQGSRHIPWHHAVWGASVFRGSAAGTLWQQNHAAPARSRTRTTAAKPGSPPGSHDR